MNEVRHLYVPVILGTTRKGRMNAYAAHFMLGQLQKREGVKTDLIDIAELRLAVDDAGEGIKEECFSTAMEHADAIVIVSPEYNHSFPGLLKHVLDSCLKEYIHKAGRDRRRCLRRVRRHASDRALSTGSSRTGTGFYILGRQFRHGRKGFRPYRFAPVSHEWRIQQLSDDLKRLGHRPFHLPVGVLLDEQNPQKSKCIRCSTCDGFPCLVEAKADAHVICVEPALEHSNVALITKSKVTRLETDSSGRTITKVHADHDGVRETYSADIVVSSCGAANSAALMLRSANDMHPNGLANSSGQVGRNYMCHVNSVMLALSRCENPTVFQKTFGLNDFYFASKDWDFPMGHISFVGKSDAVLVGTCAFFADAVIHGSHYRGKFTEAALTGLAAFALSVIISYTGIGKRIDRLADAFLH